MRMWRGNHKKIHCRDRTQLGILNIFQDKRQELHKMDATAHLHISLDFNINIPREFKCFNFQLVSLHICMAEKYYDVK